MAGEVGSLGGPIGRSTSSRIRGFFTMDLGLIVRVDPGVDPGGIRGDPVFFGWTLQVLTM